jgi:two-component system, NtrC family, sensor kinase
MKILSIILLFIVCFTGKNFSQGNANTIHLGKITPEGILLDKGWKYMTGDNPEWAKPGFDDNAWQTINPTLDVHTALPQIATSGIGWFRLHLSVDSSILKSELAFVIQQSGASEIYLNGTKIQGYGTVSSNPEKVRADDPIWKPLSITFSESAEQVIAVRYALQPNIHYTKIFETENPALTIKIMDSDRAVDYFHNNASKIVGFSFVLLGISIMIIILHLSFYILYPTQKANLYFALFAVMFALADMIQLIFWLYPNGVANKFYLGNFTFVLFIIGYVFLLTAAYLFLERKRDFFFYFLLVFSGIAIILNAWPYGFGWKIGGPTFELLVQINIARIAILSTIKKQRGAWIIAVGAVSTLVFFAIFVFRGTFTNASFLLSLPPFRIFLYIMQNISLPTASSCI